MRPRPFALSWVANWEDTVLVSPPSPSIALTDTLDEARLISSEPITEALEPARRIIVSSCNDADEANKRGEHTKHDFEQSGVSSPIEGEHAAV